MSTVQTIITTVMHCNYHGTCSLYSCSGQMIVCTTDITFNDNTSNI
jgi:hypothetical protein